MARKSPAEDPQNDDTAAEMRPDALVEGRGEEAPPPPSPGALDETVAEMVVEEEPPHARGPVPSEPLEIPSLAPDGPAFPTGPSGRIFDGDDRRSHAAGGAVNSALEPWTYQLDAQYDPEAGITRVADKRWTLRRLAPPPALGQILLAMAWFLVAANLLVLALILRDPWYTYTAPVITPLGLFMAVRLFRRWKGRRALTIRIEETLDGPVQG